MYRELEILKQIGKWKRLITYRERWDLRGRWYRLNKYNTLILRRAPTWKKISTEEETVKRIYEKRRRTYGRLRDLRKNWVGEVGLEGCVTNRCWNRNGEPWRRTRLKREEAGDGKAVESLEENGAGNCSTATKLPEKWKREDVNKGKTRMTFVLWIIKIFN